MKTSANLTSPAIFLALFYQILHILSLTLFEDKSSYRSGLKMEKVKTRFSGTGSVQRKPI